jgi:hypothetical protein
MSCPYSTQNHPFPLRFCPEPTQNHPKPIKTYPYLPKLTNNPGEGAKKKGKDRGGATHPRKKQRRKEKSTQKHTHSIEEESPERPESPENRRRKEVHILMALEAI